MGWHVMDPADSEAMAQAFIEILDGARVPYQCYDELYRRCTQLRVSRMNQGLATDDFSAEMMLSCWSTKGGLRDALRDQDVRSGRFIEDNVASDCPSCFGTGMWNPDGLGLRNGCPHAGGG